MFLWIFSENLRVFIDFTVRTVAKRIEEAAETLADFLNTFVFGFNGPDPFLAKVLCAAGQTGSLLAPHIPAGYSGRIIPKTLKEAKKFPLNKAEPQLLLALGFLRRYDASRNNTIPSQSPQCNFSAPPGTQIMRGVQRLDKYGELFFEIAYCIASGLGGEFLKVCAVSTPAQVGELLGMSVYR